MRHIRAQAGIFLLTALMGRPVFSGALSYSEDGGAGIFQLQSALLPEQATLGFSFYSHLLNTPDERVPTFNRVIQNNKVTLADVNSTVENAKLWAVNQTLAAGFSMNRFSEIHLALPLYSQSLYYSGDFTGRTVSAMASGDLRYGLKLALPVGEKKSLAFAALLGGSFPTSEIGKTPVPTRLEYLAASPNIASGPSRATGTHRLDVHAGLASTWDFEATDLALPARIHANVGVRKTSVNQNDQDFPDIFSAGAGVEYRPLTYMSVAGQYWHENLVNKPFGAPVIDDLYFGINVQTPIGISVLVGGAAALNNNAFTPVTFYDAQGRHQYDFNTRASADAQLILAVTYTGQFKPRDSDGDGIPNKLDKCPYVAQGKNGKDGCPIPDRDGDGIPDARDKCPDEAQGVFGTDGCPIHDKDNDGVPDNLDKCIDVPEGPFGSDGCPNPDSDHDGVCDPWVRESGLSHQFARECEGSDKCPGSPQGQYGKNGCPGVKPPPKLMPMEPQKAFILEGVYFQTGRAVLLPESFESLDAVARQLVAEPQARFGVSGHTDNLGDQKFNQKLSLARAQAVANYLIGKGVAPARLTVAGYGSEKPIVSNATAEGRSQNRRVEFNRLK